jgi:hypothetical protein
MTDEYKQGQINLLARLLKETKTTRTANDILIAAYDSRFIPKEIVDEARGDVFGDDDE